AFRRRIRETNPLHSMPSLQWRVLRKTTIHQPFVSMFFLLPGGKSWRRSHYSALWPRYRSLMRQQSNLIDLVTFSFLISQFTYRIHLNY
ncbi:hypothetical protein PENTCL1PPCAC_27952, partial [Pristionchus entomophagus]